MTVAISYVAKFHSSLISTSAIIREPFLKLMISIAQIKHQLLLIEEVDHPSSRIL